MGNIALGLNSLSNVRFGNNQVNSVYLGNNLVWSSFNYILDLYPTAHHAFSLRKLRNAYTGAALRIRRTTAAPNPVTTTTVDLAFDSNNTISFSSAISNQTGAVTNATTLGEFAQGTVDGLTAHSIINVVTWFDQSGNGKNPTQSTAGLQPRLVRLDTGVATLETSGGKVAVRFVRASSTRLNIADTTANINNMSSYYVGAFASTTSGQIGYTISGSSSTINMFYFPYLVNNIVAGYSTNINAIQLDTGTTTDRRLYELLAPSPLNSAVVQGWSNGVDKGTFALASGASQTIQLGARGTSLFLDGYIQEVIGWQSNANRPEKETNINQYWQIY